MAVYIVNFILIIFWGLVLKNKKHQTIIIGTQLFLILALRNFSVGEIDLNNYRSGFDYISTLNFQELIDKLHIIKTADLIWPFSYESGYTVINWLISHFNLDFRAFLIIHAFITIYSFSSFIYKNSKNVCFSFLLMLSFEMYTYSFYILRQTLALSILLFSYDMLKKEKIKHYFVLVVLAFFIHRASIVFLLTYFVKGRNISREKFLRYLLYAVCLIFITPLIYNKYIVYILRILGKTRYANSSFTLNNQILLLFGIAILILIFSNFNDISSDIEKSLYMYLFIFSIDIEILGMCNDGFARILGFLNVFSIILLPNLFEGDAKPKYYFLYLACIYSLLFVFYIYLLNGSYIVPYRSILRGE